MWYCGAIHFRLLPIGKPNEIGFILNRKLQETRTFFFKNSKTSLTVFFRSPDLVATL